MVTRENLNLVLKDSSLWPQKLEHCTSPLKVAFAVFFQRTSHSVLISPRLELSLRNKTVHKAGEPKVCASGDLSVVEIDMTFF